MIYRQYTLVAAATVLCLGGYFAPEQAESAPAAPSTQEQAAVVKEAAAPVGTATMLARDDTERSAPVAPTSAWHKSLVTSCSD